MLDVEFLVDLQEPRTEGSRFSQFVTYLLVSTTNPSGVRRRYSDFEWLREVLRLRFHGIAVPILPEKKAIGNKEQDFIGDRMKGLASFMRNIVANPYLRNDHTLNLFLTLGDSGAGEWEQAKKAVAAGDGSLPTTNVGLNQWFGVLRHLSVPSTADAALPALSAHLIELEKNLLQLQVVIAKYIDVSSKIFEALGEIKSLTTAVESTASAGVGTLSASLELARHHAEGFATIFSKLGVAVSSLHEVAKFSVNEIGLFLLDPVSKELARIQSMRDLLAVRDIVGRDYAAARQKEERLIFEQNQFALKGRQDKAAQMEPTIQAATLAVRQCKERLDDVTKGLIHVEARKFGTIRNTKFTHIFGQYAALGLCSSVKTKELWETFVASLGLSEPDMLGIAQHTLPLASSDDAAPVLYVIQPAVGITAEPAKPGAPAAAAPVSSPFTGAGAGAGLATAAALAAAAQEIDL